MAFNMHVTSPPLWPQGNGEVEAQNKPLLKAVVKAQLVDGLPSGYVRFLLDLDGKSTTRRHGSKWKAP